MVKLAGVVIAFLLAIGVSFYGGRVYQNNIDQPLFTAYTPSASTGGAGRQTSFFGAASAGSGGSAVQAALSVGTPPTSGGAASSAGGGNSTTAATPIPAKKGAGRATPSSTGSGTGSAGAAGTSTSASAAAADLTGIWAGATANTITLKSAQGTLQATAASASTHFYMAHKVAGSALAVGQTVTVSGQFDASSGGFTATSITIAPPGKLFGYVKTAQPATSSGGGTGLRFAPAGTIAALTANSLTVQTATGRALSISLGASVAVYRLDAITAASIPGQAVVTVHETTAGGKTVADNVVGTAIAGTVASLTSPPARRSGFGSGGSGGGGFGGGNGSGFGGNSGTQ